MQLNIGDKGTRLVPIEAIQPLDNDKTVKHQFKVRFEVMGKDKFSELLKDKETLVLDTACDAITDIENVKDANGDDLAWCDDVRQAFNDAPWLHEPLINAFMAVQTGKTCADYRKLLLKN